MVKSLFVFSFLVIYLASAWQTSVLAQGPNLEPNNPNTQGKGANSFVIPYVNRGINPAGFSGEGIVGTILKNVILLFFAVGGVGVVIYFLWGAVEWIFSGGDKEKVAAARRRMTHAIIGLVLLSLSYVIISVVGRIVGFNPLGPLQIRGLGDVLDPIP